MSAPSPEPDAHAGAHAGAAPGIPEIPAGDPVPAGSVRDVDEGQAPGPTPARDFWEALYTRRSIRKFKPDPVPRELVTQVLHAGMWAPSSCNYQMWDFVAVDDPAVNAQLAELSLQMGNAPVNVVVAYGRDFSEEGWANVQSASAAIQNMSLAAHVLGLGTFWITQMGDRERVREVVGLPEDRLVVAVLALGWPKVVPRKGPKRRPLRHVAHFNHYAGRPIPSSTRPDDWPADLLAVYQRARVLNGLRHNKPRAWETDALVAALAELVPEGRAEVPEGAERPRWLDVLPCTGIVTERLARERPAFRFDVVERTREVGDFVAQRVVPHADVYGLPGAGAGLAEPEAGAYDVVSCIFRLENVPRAARAGLVQSIARWTKPGGKVLLGHVSRRSFHDLTEWMRERRGGLRGVEYVLAPDPNVGPFESLAPDDVVALARAAGLETAGRLGLQPVPTRAEIEFRTRNFSKRHRRVAGAIAWMLAWIGRTPGLAARRGRFQFLALTRVH
jgi:nitroreductase/SAM-dependent methyltransferase